jgi:hypothetical protein
MRSAFSVDGGSMKKSKYTTRLYQAATLALIAEIACLLPVQAASDCSTSMTLADWGENSTGDIDVAPGRSCLLPIRIRGKVNSSEISQKPAHGKLKRLDLAAYEYTAKTRFKGSDTFAIKAAGQGPAGAGTSVITVRAMVK